MLQRFERFGAFFFEEGYLQNLPPMKPSVFKKDFVDYMKDDEFQNFLEALKLIAMKFEYDNLYVVYFFNFFGNILFFYSCS